MAELTRAEVRRALQALGIRLDEDDEEDVTFRVNAILEQLSRLDTVPLDEDRRGD
jgi:hypothetical protein